MARMPVLARLLILVSVVAVALTAVQPASAKVTRKKAMWGPVERGKESLLPVYADLGVGIYQFQLRWDRVTKSRPANPRDPADPAYDWPGFDDDLRYLASQGMQMAFLIQGSPTWASNGRFGYDAPDDPKDYADFLQAASQRYPAVRHWMIWGEPSRTTGYNPDVPKGASNQRKSKLRAQSYAKLLDTAYVRLKRMSRSNRVVGGMSFNGFNPSPGYQRPLRWLRNLKLRNGRPPRMDLYGHNPFSSRRPNIRKDQQGKDLIDLSDSDTLYSQVQKRLKRSRRAKPFRLYLSEYSIPTDKPAPVFGGFFVSRETQSSWIRSAARLARSKKIYTLGWYRLFDDAPDQDFGPNLLGLLTNDGQRKPGYNTYKNAR